MTTKNGDLPAMPITSEPYPFGAIPRNACVGMTKREQFAMAAMQALIPSYWDTVDEYETAADLIKCLMETSVEHADALLAELERTNGL